MRKAVKRDVQNKGESSAPRKTSNLPWSLISAALLLMGSAYLALEQSPRPDPSRPALPFLSWDWWAYPLEINAEARLPYVTGALTSVGSEAKGEEVVVGGQNGLLLRSVDAGRVWERLALADSLRRVHLPISARLGNRQGNKGAAKK